MKEAVAEDGGVQVLYKDWPIFGPASERAARAALAAHRQGIYPPVHDRLMTRAGPLDDVALESAVTEAGGDWRRVLDDLTGPAPDIDLQLALTQGQAFSLDLAGTPAYLIRDRLIEGATTQSQFRTAFAAVRS